MDDLKQKLNEIINANNVLKQAYRLYHFNKKWVDIVNKDVADKTYIEKFSQSILYVLTCSSVWSNQLSYLKPQLLSKLNQVFPHETIKDIKFRTTSSKEIAKFKQDILSDQSNNESVSIKQEIPETLEKSDIPWDNGHGIGVDLLTKIERVYAKDLQLKRVRKNSGWTSCKRCGGQIKGLNELCPVCLSAIHQNNENKIIQYIKEVPWAKYQDFKAQYRQITEQEFQRVRQDYKEQLRQDIYKKVGLYLKEVNTAYRQHIINELNTYVMLATLLQPQFITEEITRKKIGKRVFDILFDSPSV